MNQIEGAIFVNCLQRQSSQLRYNTVCRILLRVFRNLPAVDALVVSAEVNQKRSVCGWVKGWVKIGDVLLIESTGVNKYSQPFVINNRGRYDNGLALLLKLLVRHICAKWIIIMKVYVRQKWVYMVESERWWVFSQIMNHMYANNTNIHG